MHFSKIIINKLAPETQSIYTLIQKAQWKQGQNTITLSRPVMTSDHDKEDLWVVYGYSLESKLLDKP